MTHPENNERRTRLAEDALRRAHEMLDHQIDRLGGPRRMTADRHAAAVLGLRLGVLASLQAFEEVLDQALWAYEMHDGD